ncbi:Glycosyltransferase family 1 protein [Gammaproteobacteria bacterium]
MPFTSKKVLHLINGEFYSGAERVQDLLATCLPTYGWEVSFACLRPGKFLERKRVAHVYEIPMRHRFDFSPIKHVTKVLQEFQILHTHTPRAALIGRFAAAKANIPMVHHVHSPTRRDTENPIRNFINAYTENLNIRHTRKLVAVSESMKRYLQSQHFPADQIVVVPNGTPVWKSECEWQCPKEIWTIGTMALFRPRKGLEVLMSAIAKLIQESVPVRLLAVGSFETNTYQQSILSLANTLGISNHIEWTGFSNNVQTEFEEMDLFVLPSLYGEGLPMVLIEAMAAGLPVIGSKVEGIPELLGNNEFGIVVEPSNPVALQKGIAHVLSLGNQARTIACAGHARQKIYFSDDSMARGISRVYEEIIQSPVS